ncbi:unnamed protein product [Ixodes hexagonus]
MPRKTSRGSMISMASLVLILCLLNIFISGTQASALEFAKRNNAYDSNVDKELAKASTLGISQRIITDVQDGGHRLVEIFQDPNGTVVNCTALGSKIIIDEVLKEIPKNMVTRLTKDEMQPFMDLCNSPNLIIKGRTLEASVNFTRHIFGHFQKAAIFPGTKWCGDGDMADNYNDLGVFKETDMCCRDHDHATDSMAPKQTKHGITNNMFYTMTNCHDDCKFYNCLLKAEAGLADSVGRIFFNILQSQCFAFGHPQKCIQYRDDTLLPKVCKQYKQDTSEPKKWRIYSSTGFGRKEQPRDCKQYTNHTF